MCFANKGRLSADVSMSCIHPKIPNLARCPTSIIWSKSPLYFLWIALNSHKHILSSKLANLAWFFGRIYAFVPVIHVLLRVARLMFLLMDHVKWRAATVMPHFFIDRCIPVWRCETPSVIKVFTLIAESPRGNSCMLKSLSSYSALPMDSSGGKFNLHLSLCCLFLLTVIQLQTFLLVLKAIEMYMSSKPGSAAKQSAHACVPGW